jgi:hypothetical protein
MTVLVLRPFQFLPLIVRCLCFAELQILRVAIFPETREYTNPDFSLDSHFSHIGTFASANASGALEFPATQLNQVMTSYENLTIADLPETALRPKKA